LKLCIFVEKKRRKKLSVEVHDEANLFLILNAQRHQTCTIALVQ
jgi:hypothetical protein